jgi:hypothetical protein
VLAVIVGANFFIRRRPFLAVTLASRSAPRSSTITTIIVVVAFPLFGVAAFLTGIHFLPPLC